MIFKAAVTGFWILVIGLACVVLELARVRLGHRVYRLQRELESTVERCRDLEVEYNRLVSPDVLEKELEVLFQNPPAGARPSPGRGALATSRPSSGRGVLATTQRPPSRMP